MPTQTIKLTGSEQVAEGTLAYRFTQPSGFEFRAGQSIDLTLIDADGQFPPCGLSTSESCADRTAEYPCCAMASAKRNAQA